MVRIEGDEEGPGGGAGGGGPCITTGCTEPCIFYDAGHNQYSSDSKAHHGNVAVFAGGPVGNDSKKHDDVGDSTPMNEYMALYWAARRGRWWYQLIYEMDNVTRKRGIEPMFAVMIATAITLYGDNDAATGQAKEKRLTPKSRHTRLKCAKRTASRRRITSLMGIRRE